VFFIYCVNKLKGMRLPSIQYLYSTALQSFKRFPLSIISSFIATSLAIFLVETEWNDDLDTLFWINLMLIGALGIPFYFCVSILREKLQWNTKKQGIAIGIITLFLFLIYWSLPNSETTFNPRIPYIRYFVFNVVAHLLVSFLPYYSGSKLNGFWNYNKVLFIRIVTAFLYSGVLSLGIIIALLVVQTLFNVRFDEKRYFEIFIVFAGFFNTWFFVSGIPKDLEELEEVYEYPKGLKVFAQYVLLPLLAVYLIILYAYGTKITALWDWPKGIISYLITGVSILGIFTFLLIFPYGKQKENEWIAKFSKGFYLVLIPLIVLLFIAIFMRLGDYGITVNRYVIVLLGVWLSFLCIYFCLGKQNIKIIPISLGIMMLLASFGPWSMFAVGERTQVKRLKEILEDSGVLIEGKIINESEWYMTKDSVFKQKEEYTNSKLVNDSIYREVRSIIHYLEDYHDLQSLNEWTETNIDSLMVLNKKYKNNFYAANKYMHSLGLKSYRNTYHLNKNFTWYSINNAKPSINVSGFDYIVAINVNGYQSGKKGYRKDFTLDSVPFSLQIVKDTIPKLYLINEKDTTYFEINELRKNLEGKYISNSEKRNVSSKDLMIFNTNKQSKLVLNNINFEKRNDTIKIKSLKGNILTKVGQ